MEGGGEAEAGKAETERHVSNFHPGLFFFASRGKPSLSHAAGGVIP